MPLDEEIRKRIEEVNKEEKIEKKTSNYKRVKNYRNSEIKLLEYRVSSLEGRVFLLMLIVIWLPILSGVIGLIVLLLNLL